MVVLHPNSPQAGHPICIKLLKLLGIFLCCGILALVLWFMICGIYAMLGMNIESINPYRITFFEFAVTICPPIWYLWFVDKQLGSRIRSSSFFCLKSFCIATFLVILRCLCLFLIGDDRLHLFPAWLKEWVFLHGGNAYIESAEVLYHLDSFSDLCWKGILPFVIIAGVGEELIYRGILQNIFLKKAKQPWIAIALASILFSIVHGSLYHSIKILFMGLLLGAIYHITNNIYIPIFAHMLNNGIFLMLIYCFKDSLQAEAILLAIGKRSIWQVILGIMVCMRCIFLVLKRLVAIQHTRDIPAAYRKKNRV